MQSRIRSGVLAAAMIAGIPAGATAHHSHAMFDHTRDVTITGTVSDFVYTNPHAFLYVDVKNDAGATVRYWIEMTNIPNMIRTGITRTTFKPGDSITVVLRPLTDGKPGGNYKRITAADGKVYSYEY
jgi:hypothetical protein